MILALSVTFIILQNGVYIEDLSVPNIKIKKLYIKWNEKLNISVKELQISSSPNQQTTQIDEKKIQKLFKTIRMFDAWFEELAIENIFFNDIHASFKYIEGEKGFLVASSPTLSLKSSLFFESNLFNVNIDEFKDIKRDINVDGHLIYNNYRAELISLLNINIHDDVILKLNLFSNTTKSFYHLESIKNIKNIKNTIDMIGLPKGVLYWVNDAIKMSTAKLNYAYGWVDYKDIKNAYKNINIKATVNKLHYRYNPKLDAIHTTHTILKFRDGIFYIYPKNATSYGFKLGKSWIKIDFSKKEEMLNIFLLFKGKLNKDILKILKTYKINLPFLQKKGLVDVDLNIGVNLRNITVKARGDFFVKKGNFDYIGLNLDIFNSHITLNNYDVTIDKMLAKYKDIATSKVKVKFNAKTSRGKIKFHLIKTNFKKIGIKLKEPLWITYNISPKKDTITANKSLWIYAEKEIHVDKIHVPFDIDTLILNIPTTLVSIPNLLSGYVSGKAFLKTNIVEMNIDLLKFKTKSASLTQSSTTLLFKYNKKPELISKEKIYFDFNGLDCYIENMNINIEDEKFNLLQATTVIKNIGKADIVGEYNFSKNSGKLDLTHMKFKNKDFGKLFTNRDKITLDIKRKKNKIDVNSEQLHAYFTLTDKQWKLVINSIYNIAQKSTLLKRYNLTKGKLIIDRRFSDGYTKFNATINYPYPILVQNNIPVHKYRVNGTLSDKSNALSMVINKVIAVKVAKDIKIEMENSGVNIDALLNFFNTLKSSKDSTSSKNITFNAKNSFLYISKDRHVLSETIDMQYFNSITTAQLKHKNGKAGFRLHKNKFHLYGENFNDKFMDNLFALSKFKGGELSFSMAGTTEEYDGVFHIKEATILDYKILNNILAFINTIPALITFSLPGYNKDGLKIKSAYMNFHSKDNNLEISNLFLDSKELDILGNGTANFKTNEIDMKLNLKTALGDGVSKIPLVGYILLGKDSVSTSLSIKGALNNPNIHSLIAQDIAVAPLNIILRTLLLPAHLLTGYNVSDTQKNNKKKKKKKKKEVKEVIEQDGVDGDWY
jgi:hypothetical protein